MTRRNSNTFLLPEILIEISKILSQRDLFNCLLVNKTWHSYFLPILWRNITLKSKSSNPAPEYLEAHRQYVVNLKILHWDPLKYPFHFPSLQNLMIWKFSSKPTDIKRDHSPLKILELNTSITKLDIRGAALPLNLADWDRILTNSNLSKLTIFYDIDDMDGVKNFWKVFGKLSVLHFLMVPLPETSITDPAPLLQLQNLVANNDNFLSFADYINLSNLNLEAYSLYSLPIPGVASLPDSKYLPNLQELEVSSNIEGMDLSISIVDMKRVVRLKLRGLTLGQTTFRALRPHFNTLVEVDLLCAGKIQNNIQEILSSAPNLQRYNGGTIMAKEIAYGQPWICDSLLHLSVLISFGPAEDHLQPLVFRQLSRLVRLETIDLSVFLEFFDFSDDVHLKFSLDHGMDQISNLKMLKVIDVEGTNQKITDKDAEWMEKNLVSLKTFTGADYSSSTNRIHFYK